MPTDAGNVECLENYVATCANITALIQDSDAVHTVIAGDFNCNSGTRFLFCISQLSFRLRSLRSRFFMSVQLPVM